jgi:hypothetical protein
MHYKSQRGFASLSRNQKVMEINDIEEAIKRRIGLLQEAKIVE